MLRSFFQILIISLLFLSCKKDTTEDYTHTDPSNSGPTPYDIEYPMHFNALIPNQSIPFYNPTTVEGVALGRKLYYEEKLSQAGPFDGKSCSSCHFQSQSFTSNHPSQHNSVIPHFNIGWSNRFLWNGKISGDLERVMLFEVNDFFQTDLSGIKNDPEYKELFKKAFGVNEIDPINTSYALAQFFRTMISGNSRFDNYTLKQMGLPTNAPTSLSASEKRGLDLFMTEGKGDCFHCHGSPQNPLWTDNKYRNIGLDAVPDSGLGSVTGDPSDYGKFKTSSLRNLLFTAPYMHDGRFSNLEEVIDFYTSGIEFSSPNIAAEMLKERNLSASEKVDLIAFLKTLTDTSYTINPKLSDPDF